MAVPIELSEPQKMVITCRKPLLLNMAGQRGGKSFGIGYRSGLYVKYFPAMVGMIAANTYKQLTQSTMVEVRRVWLKYHEFTEYSRGNRDGVYVVGRKPPAHFIILYEFDNYSGIISFRNGAVIFTASLDNYLAHEGKTLGWAELDETKDTKENAVKQVILARLSQKGLYVDAEGTIHFRHNVPEDMTPFNPCVINTSPAEGVVDWLVDLFNLTAFEDEINSSIFNPNEYFYTENEHQAVCIYSTYWNAHNLPENYIDNRLAQLSSAEADKFIFGYPFARTGGEWFEEFDRREHVMPTPRLPLPDHLTYDFNLVPYMTQVCLQWFEAATEVQIRVYREYCLKPPRNTTEAVAQAFVDDYGHEITDVYYYGDAMGTRGVEGFGDTVTRFDDVRKVLFKYLYRDSDRTSRRNIGINKRRNLISKMMARKLKYMDKPIVLMVDPQCEELIKDFQYCKIGPNGKLKEKVTDPVTGRTYEKNGHASDAFEYAVCELLAGFD